MDLIDREQAMDALDALCDRVCEYSKKQRVVMCGACTLGSAFDVLEELPSARPKGKWIDGKRMGYDGTFHWFRQCSECLYEREDDTPEKDTNYCPNCGADMQDGGNI